MALCSDRLVKGFKRIKRFLSTQRKKGVEKKEMGLRGQVNKKGVRRAEKTESAFRRAGGLLRLEVSVTPVFINNARHIRPTSWPHPFFSNLRHGGSSPWVFAHFLWQQGRRCLRKGAEPIITSACSVVAPVFSTKSAHWSHSRLNMTDVWDIRWCSVKRRGKYLYNHPHTPWSFFCCRCLSAAILRGNNEKFIICMYWNLTKPKQKNKPKWYAAI